ncbi:hypothetical protein [Leifsonia naganoensis]|uniref:Uncharacterized protein n=1 Tax=Leifsonia naganoensis TaxID=150025 RepID=A0A853DPN9_9MICO|nr:hypothetical protein [Leifsonia naganoensis]NYK09469.1 hypothetical protein [Leifsonia naganoensis]
MKIRVFAFRFDELSLGTRVLVTSSILSTVISGTLTTSTLLGLTQTWVTEAGPIARTAVLWLVAAPLAWAFYVLIPLFALRLTTQGRLLGRIGLSVVAVADFVLLFQTATPLYWWANVALTAAACLSAVLAWSVPITAGGQRVAPGRDDGAVARSTRLALVLFAVGGLVGLHAVYLRRSWRCVLYVVLLALAFVGSNGPIGPVIVAAVLVLVISDFLCLDTWAAERSLARALSYRG